MHFNVLLHLNKVCLREREISTFLFENAMYVFFNTINNDVVDIHKKYVLFARV